MNREQLELLANAVRHPTQETPHMLHHSTRVLPFVASLATLVVARGGEAQYPAGKQGSSNMKVIAHVPLGGARPGTGPMLDGFKGLGRRTADITMEQEL